MTSTIPSLAVSCWAAPVKAHDQETGNNTTGTTEATGSITPATNNQLVIAASDCGLSLVGPTFSSSSGHTFTTLDFGGFVSGKAYCLKAAYFIQTTATAENVTWVNNTNNIGVSIESFK